MTIKALNNLRNFLIISLLAACGEKEPGVVFIEPQPKGIENLAEIPDKLQGEYMSVDNGSVLSIGEKFIQRTFDYEEKYLKNELDSNVRLVGDTVINITTNEKTLVIVKGDTLVAHFHNVDTIFKLNYDNVVRKYKGYYFLNKRYEGESWEVKKLELEKGKLTLSGISTEKEIENLKVITETQTDTIAPFKFNLSKKQFKQFIQNQGFSEGETFVRRKEGK